MIGDRLRLARKRVGYSLRQLAALLDDQITPQAIGRYERNEIKPSEPVLHALATALRVPDEFLRATSQIELGTIDFRRHSGTTAQERSAVEAAVLEKVERYLFIEEILGLHSTSWKAPFKEREVTSFEDVEEATREVRKRWRLGDDPIPNVTELLEQQGIKVVLLELPERVSGLTCLVQRRKTQTMVPVIVVNSLHGLERRRMTMAHELAHRLIRPKPGLDEEKAATRFASALLQPAKHVREEVGQHRHGFGVPELFYTKRLYRVSAAALVLRLRDLKIITNETMAYIFQTVGRSWRRREPEPIETRATGQLEAPRRFERLCYRALAEGLISETKAGELLDQDPKTIQLAMRGKLTGRAQAR